MKNKILFFLNNFNDYDFHEINDVLKTFQVKDLQQIRNCLRDLAEKDKFIEVENSAYKNLGEGVKFNNSDVNQIATLDNWIIKAKINEEGKYYLEEQDRLFHSGELTRLKYQDYPKTEFRATWGFRISIIAIILSLLSLCLSLMKLLKL